MVNRKGISSFHGHITGRDEAPLLEELQDIAVGVGYVLTVHWSSKPE